MSNLIKSQKVEIGTPINVGINYAFDESSRRIIQNITSAKSTIMANPGINSKKIDERALLLEQYQEEAKKAADEIYQSEVEKAHKEGITKAQEEARKIVENANKEYQNILEEIVKIKEEANNDYKRQVKDMEKDIVDLAFHIAEKIINYEVDKSDEYVIGIIKDALERVVNKKDVVLKLSMEDYSMVLSKKKLLVTQIKGFGEIEVVEDESLEPGSCIVDSPYGIMDSSLQVRMDKIQAEVEKMIKKG